MKVSPLFAILLASGIVVTSFANEAKHQAYGILQFGDTTAEARAHFEKIIAGLNATTKRQSTTADVEHHFITNGSKVPPHLSSKFSKVTVALVITEEPTLSAIRLQTNNIVPANYNTEARDAWEVLRDICNAKFGQPTSTVPSMPAAETFTQGSVPTDTWQQDTVKVTLSIRAVGKDAQRHYSVVLDAQDTSIPH